MSVYNESYTLMRYEYVQRCTRCNTLVGQDIPFDTASDICDDCFEELCTATLIIKLSDDSIERLNVNPADVTPDKVAKYVADYMALIKDMLDNPDATVISYKVKL